jgi:hypothetical protein
VKSLLELLVLAAVVVAVVWTVRQRSSLSSRDAAELENLRAFKDAVRDHALNEIEIDSTSSLGRIVLDEVREVDRANAHHRKDLS